MSAGRTLTLRTVAGAVHTLPADRVQRRGCNGSHLWVIGSPHGAHGAVWADCEQDAFDELVDHGWGRAFAVEWPTTEQDKERVTPLGNFGEPHCIDDAWIGKVDLGWHSTHLADLMAHLDGSDEDDDRDHVIEVTLRVLVYATRCPESDRDKAWLETMAADALRTASMDPHGAGESVTGWRVIASEPVSGGSS